MAKNCLSTPLKDTREKSTGKLSLNYFDLSLIMNNLQTQCQNN